MTVDDFVESWRALVVRWAAAKDHVGASDALLREALEGGLAPRSGALDVAHATAISAQDELLCEIALLRLSGLLDEKWYKKRFAPRKRDFDAVAHFCTTGWRSLLNPSPEFDLWWYWFAELGLDDNRVNPLVHYALVGRHAGLTGASAWPSTFHSDVLPSDGQQIRRAFLFAAYDVDGIVDDYVIHFLRQLAPHGDIFYLADMYLGPDELAKLSDLTVDAWAIPHGRYDFGSYAMLLQDLVGWHRLEDYDEVVLVNDSCYALMGFDHVFARMDRRACDWWGFQASKVDFATSRGAKAPMPLAEAKEKFVRARESRQMDHLHLSSYFLALRRSALHEPLFRRLVSQVAAQPDKSTIITKYEIGLSRALLASGHDFDTFIDALFPFHPLYTSDTFVLTAQGFPLLKRTFLIENSTNTPDLDRWESRVLEVAPEAPVDAIRRNLDRVAPHDQLTMSFSVTTETDGTVLAPRSFTRRRMSREDLRTPTFEHWWAFPVSATTHHLSANARALFESVRDDPSLKKVLLSRASHLDLTGDNTVVTPLASPEGQHYLLRAGVVILSDPQPDMDSFGLSDKAHLLVAAGDDASLIRRERRRTPPRLEVDNAPLQRPDIAVRLADSVTGVALLRRPPAEEDSGVHTICSGFPASDLIIAPDDGLPTDLRADVDRLRTDLAGRRLVLLAPTPSAKGAAPPFSAADATRLGRMLDDSGVALGLRESPGDRARPWAHALSGVDVVDVSYRKYPVLEVLFRLVDVFVTDYDRALVDFLLTGRSAVVYAPEMAQDLARGRLLVDLEQVLPYPVVTAFDDLLDSLHPALSASASTPPARYSWSRDLFFHHADGHSSARAALQIRRLAGAGAGRHPGQSVPDPRH